MQSISTSILFSQEQVNDFGRLTGDDGPVHSKEGIVQGGLILSCLPKYFKNLMIEKKLMGGYIYSVSMILEAKFRTKLPAGRVVTIEFTYEDPKSIISKIRWRLFDDEFEYCYGRWVIYKSKS
jgi:hypothetical protein